MKKILIFSALICVFTLMFGFTKEISEKSKITEKSSILETQYQKGWADGYCEGWKDVKGKNAYCPYPPYAPYPQYPKSSDSYKDGYNDGFKRGMSDARK